MNILFVHQNFPGQFKHLAPALARHGHRVVALHINACPSLPGVQLARYQPQGRPGQGTHRWVSDLEIKTIRAEAAYRAARQLQQDGFTPDVIVAHPAWGESLFLSQVWPTARIGIYCEFFYQAQGADVGFDPEFPGADPDVGCRLQMKNANYELHFPRAQAGIAPTHWQASTFPEPFASRITVIHDGIRTDLVCPDPKAHIRLQTANGVLQLDQDDEVITFVNRNLEPYRGYHQFMRALPALQKARPKARVVIIGGNEVSYGAAPPAGPSGQAQTWREIFLNEVKGELDLSRVHFVGKVPYADYLRVLQVSTVHVYLTYPFVLSWSLLEAMSAGCAIVASDTAPVREAIRHGETGQLVDFFDPAALVQQVLALCENPAERARLGAAARAFAVEHYDLETRCLPRQIGWVQGLAEG
ncbi:glycosyltransferase family 4 protein [Limnohabitans radicicola]|uniref:Glycosyltransferase family 4 protein n=1 Tax=Limnohabitans radicicola TaxID=2771427 RepID=A0A927FFE0_9BURK|nr:glycosyltransferase family 4 protein [Limnohabitans radicicola]MBD8050424.1 glycosyltransferase family 4 protein [Limnohabitans radicicola]